MLSNKYEGRVSPDSYKCNSMGRKLPARPAPLQLLPRCQPAAERAAGWGLLRGWREIWHAPGSCPANHSLLHPSPLLAPSCACLTAPALQRSCCFPAAARHACPPLCPVSVLDPQPPFIFITTILISSNLYKCCSFPPIPCRALYCRLPPCALHPTSLSAHTKKI